MRRHRCQASSPLARFPWSTPRLRGEDRPRELQFMMSFFTGDPMCLLSCKSNAVHHTAKTKVHNNAHIDIYFEYIKIVGDRKKDLVLKEKKKLLSHGKPILEIAEIVEYKQVENMGTKKK